MKNPIKELFLIHNLRVHIDVVMKISDETFIFFFIKKRVLEL